MSIITFKTHRSILMSNVNALNEIMQYDYKNFGLLVKTAQCIKDPHNHTAQEIAKGLGLPTIPGSCHEHAKKADRAWALLTK